MYVTDNLVKSDVPLVKSPTVILVTPETDATLMKFALAVVPTLMYVAVPEPGYVIALNGATPIDDPAVPSGAKGKDA